MDCEHARLLLNFAQPLAVALEESEAEALASHVANCPACAALDRLRHRLDERIGEAMRAVPVPAGLRDRLNARLARERRRFYLRSAMAAAAALLLALGGGWLLWPRPLVVDPVAVHTERIELPITSAGVEKWFADRGVTMKAPGDLNYHLLQYCTLAHFQGKLVPLLEFRSGQDSAWVYVLDARRFDLAALLGPPVGTGTTFTVEYRPEPGDERFGYLIISTGAGLEAFKKTPQAT